MTSIISTLIGDDEIQIIQFPLPFSKLKYVGGLNGLNLTVIVLVPLNLDECDINCKRFINLSKITCEKVSIVASVYINMGEIITSNTPAIKAGHEKHYHSFVPRNFGEIHNLFWNAIAEERVKKGNEIISRDTIVVDKLLEGFKAVNEAVHNYSPPRRRKY